MVRVHVESLVLLVDDVNRATKAEVHLAELISDVGVVVCVSHVVVSFSLVWDESRLAC